MCTPQTQLGTGDCNFCLLLRYGVMLNEYAVFYRKFVASINSKINVGNITVNQVDPVPYISTPTTIGQTFNYTGLFGMALTEGNAYQFIAGANAILQHDYAMFQAGVQDKIIKTFFIIQLFSEIGRGHIDSVIRVFERLQNLSSLINVESLLVQGYRTRGLDKGNSGNRICMEVINIYQSSVYMQRGEGWDPEPPPMKQGTISPSELLEFGFKLEFLGWQIIQHCEFVKNKFSLQEFNFNYSHLAPLISIANHVKPYSELLAIDPGIVKITLRDQMDTPITNPNVMELLAVIFIPEIVRGYRNLVYEWMGEVKVLNDGMPLPRKSFMGNG